MIGRSLCPFHCAVGCVLLSNQIYLTTIYHLTVLIYLINLPWKLRLGLGLDLKLHYFSIFHGE